MPTVAFTKRLSDRYEHLYRNTEIKDTKYREVDQIVQQVLNHKSRYNAVGRNLNVPWFFVAAVHNLESRQEFDRHLHNGDSLKARTVNVPPGRPTKGTPPFTWEESASDALGLQNLDKVKDWRLGRLLYELERYNGWGYRLYHPETLSPYLWSFSNHYIGGKYIADGTFSETAVSRQCGAAVLIRRLEEMDEITITKRPGNTVFYYSNRKRDRAMELQRFMNQYHGIHLRVDGVAGTKTSNACLELFGYYLSKDPRSKNV